jgi:hypothetical protein
MHPLIAYDLAKLKIAEQHKYAELERRARLAATDRPRWIDFSSLGQRLRARLGAGPALGGKPASAGA